MIVVNISNVTIDIIGMQLFTQTRHHVHIPSLEQIVATPNMANSINIIKHTDRYQVSEMRTHKSSPDTENRPLSQ